MENSIHLPAKHIGILEIVRKGKRKSQFVLAYGPTVSPPEEMKVFRLVTFFHHLTPFMLMTGCREPGFDYPIVVYYRIIPPGPLRHAMVDQLAWNTRKQDFLSSFPQKLKHLREQRKTASIFNLEENGELTRLATLTAQSCNWTGINIFGAGLSPEGRDPFDLVNKQVPA